MRDPMIRLYDDEIIVDSFAGGGGASTGIEQALNRSPDIAINHDEEAIAMHAVNHPTTKHYVSDVWEVDPVEVCAGRKVGLAWFSPDCKHFSKAKGGKPVDKNIRGLADVVIEWARLPEELKPRIIILENVEEFQTWGPLLPDGTPDPDLRGITFQRWWKDLENAGYIVSKKELRACDYGAPTTRKRLFVGARSDGKAFEWPEPTHGPGRLPYRTAADCIDFSIPCPSIFLTKKQAKKMGYDCKRPLAANTLRRIARGIDRYVLKAAKPFIIPLTHTGDSRVHDIDEPMRTITGAHRGEYAVVAPTMIQTSYGERKGQEPRTLNLHEPLGTVVAGGIKHSLVYSRLQKVAAFIAKHNGGNEATGQPLGVPLDTVTSRDSKAFVTSTIVKLRGGLADHHTTAQAVTEPLPTITAGGTHAAEVRAFLVQYNGTDQDPRLEDPMHAVTTKPRFALVTVHGELYAIVDIGMRMLTPRELFRAQGFPDSYIIEFTFDGELLSKGAQVRMCGNSVSPLMAKALVAANCKVQSVEMPAAEVA
jgi:DNA (cytosine-5)-methyltransferase 1